MGTLTVNATNGQTVAAGASYTVPYPAGKSAGSYLTTGAKITTSDGSYYSVIVALGVAGITVTNPTGRAIASGGFDYMDLQSNVNTVEPSRPSMEFSPLVITDKNSWSPHTALFTNTDAGMTTIMWPWAIETSRIPDALGKYYMYFSTDHDVGAGGIYMAYSDSLYGPWTQYGLVFADASGSQQTETPSVIWDDDNSRFNMYYQNSGAKYGPADGSSAIGVQSTLMCYGTNGRQWTKDPSFIVDLPYAGDQLGDGHTGYFLPFKTKRGLFAFSLYGGTDSSGSVLWQCRGAKGGFIDGSLTRNEWYSERGHLGYNSDLLYNFAPAVFGAETVQRRLDWHHGFIIESGGTEYLIALVSLFVSGGAAKTARLAIAPISADYRHLLEKPKVIWEPVEAWESSDFRTITPFVENGVLYVLYSVNKTHVGVFSHVI